MKKLDLLLVTSFFIVGLTSCHKFSSNLKVINHRGYNWEAPENTLAAFKLAKEKGYEYVETDISITKDDIPVLLHDISIDRTSNGTGLVTDYTFDELKSFSFSNGMEAYKDEKIPSLKEFVSLYKEFELKPYLELKNIKKTSDFSSILEIFNEFGMIKNATFISFSSAWLSEIKKLDSTVRLGLLCEGISESDIEIVKQLKTDRNEVFVSTSYSRTFNLDKITQEEKDKQLRLVKQNNISLEVWTIDYIDQTKNIDSYVSGITTDVLLKEDLFNLTN